MISELETWLYLPKTYHVYFFLCLLYRQFQLNHKQYKVGDFVLIASSNDDFQEDPMESAYVAKLEDLYSDGDLNLNQ